MRPLLALYSQPEVARFLLEEPWSHADAEVQIKQRLERTDLFGPQESLSLAIEFQGALIGNTSIWLTDRDHHEAEIGWTLDPASGGQGLATEAVEALLTLAFDHHRLHRIAAQMDARNTASARLAERVGMVREAHFRKNWWSKGEWTDTLIFAQLADDRL